MYTVIWLVNNDLSEASVKIHSVTGIIESKPSENSYNGNVWKKIKTSLCFWFSYQNTPYGTPFSPNLNCDLVTSLSPLNLNLNSIFFKYNALQYKVKVVITNQFLYQNTTHLNGPSSHPTWTVTLWPNYHLQNFNLKSAIFKYVALRHKVKIVITNQSLYQNTLYRTLMSPNLKCNFLTQLSPSNVDFKSPIYSNVL